MKYFLYMKTNYVRRLFCVKHAELYNHHRDGNKWRLWSEPYEPKPEDVAVPTLYLTLRGIAHA